MIYLSVGDRGRNVLGVLLSTVLPVLEAESWGCSAEQGASYLALRLEPRLRLVRGTGLNVEFLELESYLASTTREQLDERSRVQEDPRVLLKCWRPQLKKFCAWASFPSPRPTRSPRQYLPQARPLHNNSQTY